MKPFKTKTVIYSSLYTQHVTECDPIDGSPPGSAVPGVLQARTLEWVAISFSKTYSRYLINEWTNTFSYRPSEFGLLITRVYLLKFSYQSLGFSTAHVHPHNWKQNLWSNWNSDLETITEISWSSLLYIDKEIEPRVLKSFPQGCPGTQGQIWEWNLEFDS